MKIISSRILVVLCLGVLLSGCNRNYKLKMLVAEEDEVVMSKITDEINTHSRFEIELVARDSLTEVAAIDGILQGEFDITTVDNTIDYQASKKELRTVIPFFMKCW